MSVDGGAEHGHRWLVDGGVGVDEGILALPAEGGVMVTTLGGELDEVASVEVDAVVVEVVGVFLRDRTIEAGADSAHVVAVESVGREDDVSLAVLVNLGVLHLAHPVVALGQLGETALLAVIEIEMCVSVAVALPEDVVGVEVAAQVAGVGDVLVVLLLNEGADVALQIHLEHTVGLVAAFIELEREGLAILVPAGSTHFILRGKELGGFGSDGLLILYINDDGDAVVERVAGLGILEGGVDGLHLCGGGGLGVGDVVLGRGLDEHGGVVASVLRPASP